MLHQFGGFIFALNRERHQQTGALSFRMSFGGYGSSQTSIRGPKHSSGRSGGGSSSLPSIGQKVKKTLFLLLSEQRGPALRRPNVNLFISCFWSQNGNAGFWPREHKYKLKFPPRKASVLIPFQNKSWCYRTTNQ